jgi:hypothetical protein
MPAKPGAKKRSPVVKPISDAQLVSAAQGGSNASALGDDARFSEVVTLIEAARSRAY